MVDCRRQGWHACTARSVVRKSASWGGSIGCFALSSAATGSCWVSVDESEDSLVACQDGAAIALVVAVGEDGSVEQAAETVEGGDYFVKDPSSVSKKMLEIGIQMWKKEKEGRIVDVGT